MNESPVFLIGPRGSGKSTVARLLAEAWGWSWIDADLELEKRYGQSIRAIFAAEGEADFREKETAVLADLCRMQRSVIATGGGVVLREDNRERLRAAGRIVWLTADIDTLWQRMQADSATAETRPALSIGGREEIAEVLRFREPLYRSIADAIVDTSGRSPDEVAAEIMHCLQPPLG